MSVSVLVLLAVCLSSGTALKCYSCVSSSDNDYCSNSNIKSGRIEPAECPIDELRKQFNSLSSQFGNAFGQAIPTVDIDVACIKKLYTKPNGMRNIERTCVPVGPDVCRDGGSETVKGRVDFCGTCKYDGCNSAGRIGGNFLWLLPLAAFLLRH